MELSVPTLSIESVELCPFLASLRRPVRSRAERAGWRLWIRDSLGRVGEGEAVCWPGFGQGEAATSKSLERGVEALSGFRLEVEADARDLNRISAWLEALALAPEARHAFETALLDLLAQIRGVPLACLFGPLPRDQVWSQALVGDGEETRAARQEGYRHFKLKVGASSLEADLARVSEVRAALGATLGVPLADPCLGAGSLAAGSGLELRVDANGLWSRSQATRFVEATASLGLSWIEQPLPPGDLEGLVALRRLGARVAVDEGLRDATDLEAHIQAEALDAVVLKPAFLGGPLATLSLARRAAKAGLEVMVTHALDGEIGRLAAFHVALAAPRSGRPNQAVAGLSPSLCGDAGPSGPLLAIQPGPWLPPGSGRASPTSAGPLGLPDLGLRQDRPSGLGSSTAALRLARCEAVSSTAASTSAATSSPSPALPSSSPESSS